jgi:hypothetical protein
MAFTFTNFRDALLLIAGACITSSGCAHRSSSPPPDSVPAHAVENSVSPDGKWAVMRVQTDSANPEHWAGLVERKGKLPALTIAEDEPDSFNGTVEETVWSPDSRFVACRIRKGHYVDDLFVARWTACGWITLHPPTFDLSKRYSKWPATQKHNTEQTGGEWIDSMKWATAHTLHLELHTNLTIDGPMPKLEPRRYAFSAGLDYDFNSSSPRMHWSGEDLQQDSQ